MHEYIQKYADGLEKHVEKWIAKGKDPAKRRKAADCLLTDLDFFKQWYALNDEPGAIKSLKNAFRIAAEIGIVRRVNRMFIGC